jgi:hypothetical protein
MKTLYRGRVVGVNFRKDAFNSVMEDLQKTPADKIKFDLRLVPEPDNAFDPNAVKVLFGNLGGVVEHIGYIPKDQAPTILQYGVDNVKIEVVNFNKFQNEFKGLDIMVTTKE